MRTTTAPVTAPIVPGRFPLLGHLPQLAVQRVDFLQSVRAQGDIVRIFLGNRPVFVLNSPEAVHSVLVTQSRKFGKGLLFDIARPFVGNGIITSERDFHRRQRRALQLAFHRDSVAACAGTMTDIAEEQVSSWSPGEVIAMDLVMRRMMTVMLVATLFSTERPDGAAAVAELGERVAEHLTTVMRGVFVGTVLPVPIASSPALGHRKYLSAAAALRDQLGSALPSSPPIPITEPAPAAHTRDQRHNPYERPRHVLPRRPLPRRQRRSERLLPYRGHPAGPHLAPRRRLPLPRHARVHRGRVRPVPGGPGSAGRRRQVPLPQGDVGGLYVPPGGLHAFKNVTDEPMSMLMLFSPGVPREDFFERVAEMSQRGSEELKEFRVRHDSYFEEDFGAGAV